MAKLWNDTRPDRPAGDYLVGGVVFTGGHAETKSVSPGTAALFAALGIVEVKPPADTVDEPAETPDPEVSAPPKRSRGAK